MDMQTKLWLAATVVCAGVFLFGLYLAHRLKKELLAKQAAQVATKKEDTVIERASVSAVTGDSERSPAGAEGAAPAEQEAGVHAANEKIQRMIADVTTVSLEQHFLFSLKAPADADIEVFNKALEKEQASPDAREWGPLVKQILESKLTTPAAVPLDLKPGPKMQEAAHTP